MYVKSTGNIILNEEKHEKKILLGRKQEDTTTQIMQRYHAHIPIHNNLKGIILRNKPNQ